MPRRRVEEWQELPLWAALGGDCTDVWLQPDLSRFATWVGNRRQDTAIALDLKNNNRLAIDRPRDRRMHIVGGRSEAAAWTYLFPIHWRWYIFGLTRLPDLGKLIEVKGTESRGRQRLILPKKGGIAPPSEWAYLLVDASQHPLYRMVGWLYGWEFLDDAHVDWSLPRPAWAAEPARRPREMLALVRQGKL